MAKSNVEDRGELGVRATVKPSKPKSSDYYISGVNIKPATNGFIVTCQKTLKPSVRASNSKKEIYCDSYIPGEDIIADSADAVRAIVMKELADLSVGDGE